jgi:hypothetical protein
MALARAVSAVSPALLARGMGTLSSSLRVAEAAAPVQARSVPAFDEVSESEASSALQASSKPGARYAAGALTLKPIAFKYRKWELQRYETVCPFDACGTPIYAYSKQFTRSPYDKADDLTSGGEKVIRVLPRPDEELMSDAISDKTRFGWEGAYRGRSLQARAENASGVVSTSRDEIMVRMLTWSAMFKPVITSETFGPLHA